MRLRTDIDHQESVAERLLRAAATSQQAASAARTDTATPINVAHRLDLAVKLLIQAVWATRHGAGHHGSATRSLRSLWVAAYLRRLRRVGRMPSDPTDRAKLALIQVGRIKGRVGTFGFHPALTCGLVEAWLLLGQAEYAMSTGAALEVTAVRVPEIADDVAAHIMTIVDLLERVVVTMIDSGNAPALATAAGSAALALEELTNLANAASRHRRGRLDLTEEPLDLPSPSNAGDLKDNSAEIAAWLRKLSTMSKNAADVVDAEVAWRRAMAVRLRRSAFHLTTASTQIAAWGASI